MIIPLDRILGTSGAFKTLPIDEECPILISSIYEAALLQINQGYCYLLGVIIEGGNVSFFDGMQIYAWSRMNPTHPKTRNEITTIHYFALNRLMNGTFSYIATQLLSKRNPSTELLINRILQTGVSEFKNDPAYSWKLNELAHHFLTNANDEQYKRLAIEFINQITDPTCISPFFSSLIRNRVVAEDDMSQLAQALQTQLNVTESIESQYATAVSLLADPNNIEHMNQARQTLRELALRGYPHAQFIYAWIIFEEHKTDIAYAHEAAIHFKNAADQQIIEAQFAYAQLLNTGLLGQKDPVQARHYARLAAVRGMDKAQLLYAEMLSSGIGGPIDKNEARKYRKLAADQELPEAQHQYAQMLFCGIGGVENKTEAARYCQYAAAQGHCEALFDFGVMAFQGMGVAKSKETALLYFCKAKAQGHIEADQFIEALSTPESSDRLSASSTSFT